MRDVRHHRRALMIPIPNVLAGVLIGYANSSWPELLISVAAWPVVYCVYVSLVQRRRVVVTVGQFRERGRRFLFGSPTSTFFAIEFVTAFLTALLIACAVFAVKRAFL